MKSIFFNLFLPIIILLLTIYSLGEMFLESDDEITKNKIRILIINFEILFLLSIKYSTKYFKTYKFIKHPNTCSIIFAFIFIIGIIGSFIIIIFIDWINISSYHDNTIYYIDIILNSLCVLQGLYYLVRLSIYIRYRNIPNALLHNKVHMGFEIV